MKSFEAGSNACLSVGLVCRLRPQPWSASISAASQPQPSQRLSLMRDDDEVIRLCSLSPRGFAPCAPRHFSLVFFSFLSLIFIYFMLCFPHCAPFSTWLCQSKYGVSWCDIFFLGGATRLSYEFWQVRKWMSSPYLPPPWTSVPSVDQQWEPNQPESCIAGVTCSWQIPRKTPESFYFFFFLSWGRARED